MFDVYLYGNMGRDDEIERRATSPTTSGERASEERRRKEKEKGREHSGKTTTEEKGESWKGGEGGHTHIHTLRCTALRQPSARRRWPNDQKNNARG